MDICHITPSCAVELSFNSSHIISEARLVKIRVRVKISVAFNTSRIDAPLNCSRTILKSSSSIQCVNVPVSRKIIKSRICIPRNCATQIASAICRTHGHISEHDVGIYVIERMHYSLYISLAPPLDIWISD
jgi:hypothetical protein